jgi:dolichol-phosphate mannosyltransferase
MHDSGPTNVTGWKRVSSRFRTSGGRKVWIVLPAYNEEQDLPSLLERIDEATEEANLRFEVLVVDDGSLDATAEVASLWANKLPLQVMTHEENEGLGSTLRDGLKWACQLAQPSDVIVTLDADNTHTPELILRMVRTIREGHDVVVASRFVRGSKVRGVPFNRRVLSRLAGVLFKVAFPIRGIRDYTCGYRAYRAGLLQEVTAYDPSFFDQDGFQVMVDILLKLRRRKDLIFGEVPLILRYDLKEGSSKMDVGGTIRGTLALMWKRKFV